MKRITLIICFVVAMIAPTNLLAQTPEEVVERMSAELNKDKDDPKRMNIAVSKADYSCIYLKTKTHGIGISMENFKIGVTDKQVTFNPADFPNAKIIDER